MAKQIEAKNRAIRKTVGATSIEGRKHVDTQGSQVRRMTARELDDKRVRGLCYMCNSKWSLGNKCAEKKLFIIEDNNEEEAELTMASMLTMAGANTPQTLKIEGSIKNQKVMVLINSGSTHNFIHKKLAK